MMTRAPASKRRDQIGEGFTGAGAGFNDQCPAVIQNGRDRRRHILLLRARRESLRPVGPVGHPAPAVRRHPRRRSATAPTSARLRRSRFGFLGARTLPAALRAEAITFQLRVCNARLPPARLLDLLASDSACWYWP
jgi:hypothetical protein